MEVPLSMACVSICSDLQVRKEDCLLWKIYCIKCMFKIQTSWSTVPTTLCYFWICFPLSEFGTTESFETMCKEVVKFNVFVWSILKCSAKV